MWLRALSTEAESTSHNLCRRGDQRDKAIEEIRLFECKNSFIFIPYLVVIACKPAFPLFAAHLCLLPRHGVSSFYPIRAEFVPIPLSLLFMLPSASAHSYFSHIDHDIEIK
jgi:hypothetical protein